MDIKQIKTDCTKLMKQGIDGVLSGTVKSVDLFGVRPGQVEKYLKEQGIDTDHEMETNGWQWDFWFIYHDDKDQAYQLSGDGYYNQSVTFTSVEEGEY